MSNTSFFGAPNTSLQVPLKSKRHQLTLFEKKEIINAANKNSSQSELAKRFGVARTTIIGIIKSKEAVINAIENGADPKRNKIKQSKYEDHDKAMFSWFCQIRSHNLPVSGQLLQQKAKEIAVEMNLVEFCASNGWLRNFLRRHSIILKTNQGEAGDINITELREWQQQTLQETIQQYSPEDVFNVDEAGLFWRLLPNKTFAFKGKNCTSCKKNKERITMLLGANMTGTEKLPILIIGRSNNPRCFKNATIPVRYVSNKKSWMTATIFENWLKEWDRKLIAKGRKVLLFVDKCSAHPSAIQLSNINLKFFLPNTTALAQPMDQGIIQNVKIIYKRLLLRKMIDAIDANISFTFNLLNALQMLQQAWVEVKVETIKNCFKKAHFIENEEIHEVPEDDAIGDEELNVLWQYLKSKDTLDDNISLNDYMTIDEELVTYGDMTIKEVIESVINNQNNESIVSNDSNELVNEVEEPPVSYRDAQQAWGILRRYLENNEKDLTMLNIFYTIDDVIAKHRSKELIQKKLTDYVIKN